jgi:hypothetical protein
MMSPTYNRRLGKPTVGKAALTVPAHNARPGMAAPKHRVTSGRQERQGVALTERTHVLWTLQRLRSEKTDHIFAMARPIAIQCLR